MRLLRSGTLWAGLLLMALACADGTAPGADQDSFTLRVNNEQWQLSGITAWADSDELGVYGYRTFPNTLREYGLNLHVNGFSGAGTYTIVPGRLQGLRIHLFLEDSLGDLEYDYPVVDTAATVLHITRFQSGDSTIVGSFHAVFFDPDAQGRPLTVDGAFRQHLAP